MTHETQLQDITQTIQLAIAPVFLLSAIGTTLGVLTTRLGRVVDRARRVEELLAGETHADRPGLVEELKRLDRRARLIHMALTSGTVAALLVCMLIAVAFVGYLFEVKLGAAVAVIFILAMAALVTTLVFFLREIFLAIATLRFSFPPEVAAAADQGLHEACYRGNLEQVRALVEQGADVNGPAGPGPIHWVSAAGLHPRPLNCVAIAWFMTDQHLAIARLLIEKGARVDDTVISDHNAESAGLPIDSALRKVLLAAREATPAPS